MPSAAASGTIRRIGRVLAAVGLIAFAVLALLSGTDRQSREFPNSPGLVGWPYDSGAARSHAISAFVQKGPATAIGFARRAILSDPLSAQSVSILGRAQLYGQQSLDAHKTFEVAGQLGWRDAMTQIYWMDQAMQAGDLNVAAQRLDALLRQSPHDENRDKLLAVISATPEGRAALAERLQASPIWAAAYVTELKDVSDDQLLQRVDIANRLKRGTWGCQTIAPMAQKLIDTNLINQALTIWQRYCLTSASLVYDGGFEQLDTTKPTTGFDWQLSGRGDIDVEPTADQAGNRQLDFEVNAARTLPVLSQRVVLQPGTYRLTWRTPDTDRTSARALSVSMGCKLDQREAAPGNPVADTKDRYAQEFTVDGTCPTRQLGFWLAPKIQIRLDDVTLQRN